MNSETMYVELAKCALGESPSDQDALCFAILVHTHHVYMKRPFEDRPDVSEMCAITRADAAESLATFWPDVMDFQRKNFHYWLERYATETPYEVVDDIPVPELERVLHLRSKLLNHPEILDIQPED